MTNIKASIFAAFERMWFHMTDALNKKADKTHEHDNIYNKSEVDVLLSNKSDSDHNHDGRYEEKGASDGILANANAYTDSQLAGKADAEHTHEVADITDLPSQLNTKVPATRKINDKTLDVDITLNAADVGADASGSATNALSESKTYTDTEVAKKATPAQIDSKIVEHNVDTAAHNDIRISLSELTTKVNNFLDVDDTTTDQLSELLTLISENADDIETITNGKVNVSDIIDNLTTNVSDKPLSAAQGVAIKALIDTITDAKADWNQNDETAIDYVKNRTHWIEQGTGVCLIPAQSFSYPTGESSSTGYRYLTVDSTVELSLDKTYRVVYNGITYEGCKCLADFSPAGNIAIVVPVGEGDIPSESVCIAKYSDTEYRIDIGFGVIFQTDANGNRTIAVYEVSETVHKLNEVFIPDSIARIEDVVNTYATNDALNSAKSSLQSSIDAKQPLESTTFSHANDTYISVRTPSRTANQYYEFWDNVGWAGIQGGQIVAHNGFVGNLNGNATSATTAANADYAASAGFKICTDGELNNYTKTGVYTIKTAPSTNGVSSVPSANWGTLIVDGDIGTPYQIFIPDGDVKSIFKRSLASNTWSEISAGYASSAGYAASATNDGSGNNIASTYLPKSGGTMTGTLRVNNAPIFGYRYGQSNDAPAFVFDKPGGNYTGIGANGETDTIYFGAANGTDWTWNKDYKQKWKFNGSIIADILQLSNSSYGTSLPSAGTAGRVFFKKV